jgi:hypothetical protein
MPNTRLSKRIRRGRAIYNLSNLVIVEIPQSAIAVPAPLHTVSCNRQRLLIFCPHMTQDSCQFFNSNIVLSSPQVNGNSRELLKISDGFSNLSQTVSSWVERMHTDRKNASLILLFVFTPD